MTAVVPDCLFCRLARREGEVSVVYDGERTVVFMDIRPAVRGHAVVVPRSHAARLADLDPNDGAALFRTGQRVAKALYDGALRCEGVNLSLADGEVAGQEIDHVHLHVIPRHRDDGYERWLAGDHVARSRAELDDDAAALRDAWSAQPPPQSAASNSS